MIQQTYKDIVTADLLKGAIENNEYTGFREDYHVLHCLLRKYEPNSILEIGTNMGTGTKIIKNAIRGGAVYSLDLPTELAHISLQHPINEGKGDKVGSRCNLPFIQLRGDSLKYDFSEPKCEAYFIDGEHDYEHPYRETTEVLKNHPKLIVWHDSDMEPVREAIVDAMGLNKLLMPIAASENELAYNVYRVTDTRIAYAVRKVESSVKYNLPDYEAKH